MLKSLTQWIQGASVNNNDQPTWLEWQKRQPVAHYEKSDIFQYYLSYRPQFEPPPFSSVSSMEANYYIYCFGDFASLISNPPSAAGNVADYLALLLDVYDTCKGMTRRITGDPAGILLLRDVVKTRNLTLFNDHDFSQYNYDYTKIHAHTVAQFSLSFLIMRFASNYHKRIDVNSKNYVISGITCKNALDCSNFGRLNSRDRSTAIPIAIPKTTNEAEYEKPMSWPRDQQQSCARCQICSRIGERAWGKFNACIDCHMKRICSVCAHVGVVITTDGLPKCSTHQHL